jgi:hypothetical protein
VSGNGVEARRICAVRSGAPPSSHRGYPVIEGGAAPVVGDRRNAPGVTGDRQQGNAAIVVYTDATRRRSTREDRGLDEIGEGRRSRAISRAVIGTTTKLSGVIDSI